MGTTASKDEADDVNFTPKAKKKLSSRGNKEMGGGATISRSSKLKNGKKGSDPSSSAADSSRLEESPQSRDDRLSGRGSEGVSASAGSKSPRDKAAHERTSQLAEETDSRRAGDHDDLRAFKDAVTNETDEILDDVLGKNDGSSGFALPKQDVHVNLPMADLMAYLQVVANNSSNLPLTRRDDPELGRTVSTLTADEYARKAAAFIPADVRIIGGSYTKYGRVWDLPTSEEYNPADGAQEPGISHGGACCNALLKVLYDTESEAVDMAAESQYMNPDALFDDDDETNNTPVTNTDANTAKSFDSLVLGDVTTVSTISVADLLRKMKVEMQNINFSQVPTITSSRKFDLNKPFSLVPEGFDPKKNKKRSLLIGCNYPDLENGSLKASHDDVRSIKDFIVNVHGFAESSDLMTVLLDDDDHKHPTYANITAAFKRLSEECQPGDAVFIQFSGHGCRILDSNVDTEAESYDEAIIPSDYAAGGMIRDTILFKTLLAPMRYGVTVTCVIDCCDTGVMIDLPYSWSTKSEKPDAIAKMSLNDNFSFVRFLKVVKTLYEMSTFTQLGKTVRSALNEKRALDEETDLDDDTQMGSLVTMDETEEHPRGNINGGRALMQTLAACYNPPVETKRSRRRGGNRGILEETKPRREDSSLLSQVMNCTLNTNDEESDEETFNPASHGDDNTYDESDEGTYETAEKDRQKNSRARGRP